MRNNTALSVIHVTDVCCNISNVHDHNVVMDHDIVCTHKMRPYHQAGRAITSDWSVNSFIMVV